MLHQLHSPNTYITSTDNLSKLKYIYKNTEIKFLRLASISIILLNVVPLKVQRALHITYYIYSPWPHFVVPYYIYYRNLTSIKVIAEIPHGVII